MIISSGSNNKVYNNFIYGNAKGGIQVQGSSTKIWNNTVYNNSANGSESAGIEIQTTGADVRNNIVYNNAGGAINGETDNSVSSNLFTNPSFANAGAGDLHLTSGSPKNNGVIITEVTTDIDGNHRPLETAYDIGADEFDPAGGGPTGPFTYYVDGDATRSPTAATNCTQGQSLSTPWRTIDSALACLAGGDTLYIRGFTYAERINTSTRPIPGGTDWNTPTLISNYQSETVTLAPSGTSPVVTLNVASSQYIIFHKLTFDAQGTAERALLISGPANHIRVEDSILKNSTLSLLRFSSTSNNEVLRSTAFTTPGFLVYIEGTSSNNTFTANDFSNSGAGSTSGAAIIRTEGTGSGNSFQRNTIHNPASPQTEPSVSLAATGGSDKVINNVIYGGNCGIRLFPGAINALVYNNTVYNHSNCGIQIDSGAPGAQVKNNIVYESVGITNNAGASLATNLLPPTDPLFVNAAVNNFHLQACSTARNAGTTLAEVTVDRDNTARPQDGSNYDIGAYEETASACTPPVLSITPFTLRFPR